MNENVIAGRALDESVALRVVKPFHLALFLLHIFVVPLNSIDFLAPLSQLLAKNEKGHKINDSVAFDVLAYRSQKLIKPS